MLFKNEQNRKQPTTSAWVLFVVNYILMSEMRDRHRNSENSSFYYTIKTEDYYIRTQETAGRQRQGGGSWKIWACDGLDQKPGQYCRWWCALEETWLHYVSEMEFKIKRIGRWLRLGLGDPSARPPPSTAFSNQSFTACPSNPWFHYPLPVDLLLLRSCSFSFGGLLLMLKMQQMSWSLNSPQSLNKPTSA